MIVIGNYSVASENACFASSLFFTFCKKDHAVFCHVYSHFFWESNIKTTYLPDFLTLHQEITIFGLASLHYLDFDVWWLHADDKYSVFFAFLHFTLLDSGWDAIRIVLVLSYCSVSSTVIITFLSFFKAKMDLKLKTCMTCIEQIGLHIYQVDQPQINVSTSPKIAKSERSK